VFWLVVQVVILRKFMSFLYKETISIGFPLVGFSSGLAQNHGSNVNDYLLFLFIIYVACVLSMCIPAY
jgi:hypothetical protein